MAEEHPGERRSGVLLHPTSLPSPGGIGDLGAAAHAFVDWLADAGQRLWQVLPLGPTDGHGSPYSSFSSVAGNPLLISLDQLHEGGLLPAFEATAPTARVTDFQRVREEKLRWLGEAFPRFVADAERREALARFREEHAGWLDDWALFVAVKETQGEKSWLDWPPDLRGRKGAALADARRALADRVAFHEFVQYVFWHQWSRLHARARERGIAIVGDVPFYVALDSVDVWANPELFDLHRRTRRPRHVAGVPPDPWSPTGQLWGMPVFRWRRHKRQGFAWWVRRFRRLAECVDIVRIDHFCGFGSFWRVRANRTTAVKGKWVRSPGRALFRRVLEECPGLRVWAEDLGRVTPKVEHLLAEFGFPGMKILHAAFDGDATNAHLPFHHPRNAVVYTGTHDNDTTHGWWEGLDSSAQQRVASFFDSFDAEEVHWHLIDLAMGSPADHTVIPIQDVLGLGRDARMNVPGSVGGNWTWRLDESALTDDLAARLRQVTEKHGR